MRDLAKKISPKLFLTLGSYEEDADFKELLRSLAQQGLILYGILGSLTVIGYVTAHVYAGETMWWDYSTFNPDHQILMLDKTLILIVCLSIIPFSFTSISLTTIRSIIFALVWLCCMAMLMDDIAAKDTSFMTGYITPVLIFAVAMVPYKGWQMALLGTTVIISGVLLLDFAPLLLNSEEIEIKNSQLIFITVIVIILTGMSSQLYINRYQQHLAKKEAEELSRKLKERAKILQRLKHKSELQAKQLLENEKLKDRFFANVSHEFRTPLTVIMGPLKDLLKEKGNSDTKVIRTELIELMHKNGQHLLELINQLLDLSKVDAGQIKLDLKEVDLSKLIRDQVLSFGPLAESQRVQLACELPSNPIFTEVDPQQMERVIGNLVSNAIKFTSKDGRVTVSLAKTDSVEENIQIIVDDTGIGIPEDELLHIFDRFYQVAHSSGRVNSGTGIGLSLAKEIVELHGGQIDVISESGSGSRFIINLPNIVPESKGSINNDSGKQQLEVVTEETDDFWEETGRSEDAPTVLIVDDNPDILAYLEPCLSRRYGVIAKQESAEALELVRKDGIDLVISDVMMPAPDGFELCKTIKESPELNHIPVILLTAQASEESRIEGLEIGADDYISKPFSASELLIRVENLIDIRKKLRNKFSQQVRIKGEKVDVTSEDARFLKKVQAVIEAHMEDANFSVDWLASEVNFSSRQLQRKLRSITELSAGGYIRLMRLERASQLLRQQWGNISEIAYKVGFQDAKYFSRLFKQTFGVTPSEYIESES